MWGGGGEGGVAQVVATHIAKRSNGRKSRNKKTGENRRDEDQSDQKKKKEKKKKEIHIWKCNHFLPIQSLATFPTGVYV